MTLRGPQSYVIRSAKIGLHTRTYTKKRIFFYFWLKTYRMGLSFPRRILFFSLDQFDWISIHSVTTLISKSGKHSSRLVQLYLVAGLAAFMKRKVPDLLYHAVVSTDILPELICYHLLIRLPLFTTLAPQASI